MNRNRCAAPSALSDESASEDQGNLGRFLLELGAFVKRLRLRSKFADVSRAPLRLLRIEVRGDYAECEWIARPPDEWDSGMPAGVGEQNASTQALCDAMRVRDLLFKTLPSVQTAALRIYRISAGEELELVITGSVTREQLAPSGIRSLAMRAKLAGLRFWLDDGVLADLRPQEYAVNA